MPLKGVFIIYHWEGSEDFWGAIYFVPDFQEGVTYFVPGKEGDINFVLLFSPTNDGVFIPTRNDTMYRSISNCPLFHVKIRNVHNLQTGIFGYLIKNKLACLSTTLPKGLFNLIIM